ARRPATRAAPGASATCSTRTSIGTCGSRPPSRAGDGVRPDVAAPRRTQQLPWQEPTAPTAPRIADTMAKISRETEMSIRLNRPRAVPAIMSVVALAGPLLCLPQSTSAQSAAQKQAQCELSAIGATRSAVALQSIRTACNWLVVNEGSLLNESLR